jgi:hypothetical protein
MTTELDEALALLQLWLHVENEQDYEDARQKTMQFTLDSLVDHARAPAQRPELQPQTESAREEALSLAREAGIHWDGPPSPGSDGDTYIVTNSEHLERLIALARQRPDSGVMRVAQPCAKHRFSTIAFTTTAMTAVPYCPGCEEELAVAPKPGEGT